MRLGIIGSRKFNDYDFIKTKILKQMSVDNIDCIVSGGAPGVDSLAEKFAKEFNIPTLIFLPDWKNQGKKAAFLRNNEIVNSSDFVIAFWDMKSTGTEHSLSLCKKQKKPFMIVNVNDNEINLECHFKGK